MNLFSLVGKFKSKAATGYIPIAACFLESLEMNYLLFGENNLILVEDISIHFRQG